MRTLKTHVLTVSDIKEAMEGLPDDAIIWVYSQGAQKVGVVTSHDTNPTMIDDTGIEEPGLSLYYSEV